jgi:DNA repair protein SbcC/Rad50
MRINRLVIAAFGPFKDVQTIDFSTANRNGIFLVSGPTGAGKTTVFDAISFALYGKASGSNRSDAEMTRSHFADPETETYVELDFEIDGHFYSVRRSPKQDRPSTRSSSNMVTIQHKAEFIDHRNPDSVLVKVGEVNAEIERILGLSHDQFRQIVMLPQGEFQALLNASSDTRTDIFRRIFSTGFFETFQNRLKDETDRLKSLINTEETRLMTYAVQINTEERPELERVSSGDPIDWDTLDEMLGTSVREDRDALKAASAEEDRLALEADALKERLSVVRTTNLKIEKKGKSEEELKTHLKDQDRITEDEHKVRSYEKALSIRPDEQSAQHANNMLQRSETALRTIVSEIETLETRKKAARKAASGLPELQKHLQKARDTARHLDGVIGKVNDKESKQRALQTISDRIGSLKKDIDARNGEIETLGSSIIKTTEEIASCERIISQSNETYARLNDFDQRLRGLHTLSGLIKDHHEELKRFEEDSKRFVRLSETFSEIEGDYREVQRLYVNAHAARLARDLKEGEPCPVCGARSHPDKAVLETKTIDDKTFMEKDQAYERARQDYNREDARIRERKNSIEHEMRHRLEKEARALGFASVPEADILKDMTDQATRALEEIRDAVEGINDAQKRKASHTEQLKSDQSRLETLVKERDLKIRERATAEGAARQTKENLDAIVQALGKDDDSLERLMERQQDVQKDIQAAEEEIGIIQEQERSVSQALDEAKKRQQDILGDLESWKDESRRLEDIFKTALDLSFASLDAYQKALSIKDDVEHMTKGINRFKTHKTELETTIKTLDQDIGSKTMEDPAPHVERLENAESVLKEHRARKETIQTRHATNDRLLREIRSTRNAFADLDKEYARTNRISMIARGMTGNKITFERYILAHWFTEILDSANMKLDTMTGGRYRLHRKGEKGKGAAQQGLDLQVFDAYTTSSRDVKTLSGGESFKAALALALGLAEIVQRTSGGISLETMFIDEGFGSLDPESLDVAVETLMDINRTGRVIGVISHVGDLKSRIETKIEVGLSSDGSIIRQ